MQNHDIRLRHALEDDIPSIGLLYSETVRNVNSKDYSPGQIAVWSSSGSDPERWKNRITEQHFMVAELSGVVAGFGSITKDGYLDFMYVHKDYQRMGIAKTILNDLERKAAEQNNNLIYSHVSKTAHGFFEKHGYIFMRELSDPYKGVVFINALMIKPLLPNNLNKDIKTARTLLRKYTPADRQISTRLSLDKEVMHFMGGEHPQTEEEASMIFDKCFEIYNGLLNGKPLGSRRFEIWGIQYEGALVGHFELKETPNTAAGELEIVYMLNKEYWGKGLIPEAIIAVNDYAKSCGKTVIATINPENKRTVRSLEKTGIAKQFWVGEGEDRVYKVWLK